MTTIFRPTLRQRRAKAYWRYFDAALDYDDDIAVLWAETVSAATPVSDLVNLSAEEIEESADRIVTERYLFWA